jgi:hypothetical protein
MSSDNPTPEQGQTKIAMALGRLRGDVMPPITSQAAPRLSESAAPSMPPAPSQRAEPSFTAVPGGLSGGLGNGAGVTPPNFAGQPLSASPQPSADPAPNQSPTLGNNASASDYFATTPGGASQPDLLAGVDMGPPPLGAKYPQAEDNDGRRQRNRRYVLMGAALAVIVIAGFWIGTRHHGDVPVIAADATPEKVKPTDQGGMQVPNQNVQVLENMNGQPAAPSGETVLPPPEQPVAPPAPAVTETPAAPGATADQTIQVPTVPTPAPTTDAATAAAPVAPAVPAVPAVPDNSSAAMTAAPAVPAAPATTPAAATPSAAAAPITPTAVQTAAKPATTDAAPVAKPGGKIRVQLAAVKSEAAAKATWAKLQKAHPAQLGKLDLIVEKVDKGAEGIFYRVQAGPLSDKATAKSICAALAQQGQACLVAR